MEEQEKERPLVDLIALFYRSKKFIIIFVLVGMLLSVGLSILSIIMPPEKSFMPNQYTAEAVMLIKQQDTSSSLLSSISDFAGISLGGQGTSSSSLAQYLVTSNLLFDDLNKEFHFTERMQIEKGPVTKTRAILAKKIKKSYDSSCGIFKIYYTDINPEFAQQVVNFTVDWLENKFTAFGIDNYKLQKENLEKNIESTYLEITRLEEEAQKLSNSLNSGSTIWSLPTSSTEYSKIKMELTAKETVYSTLRNQYEMLLIQMQSEQPVFQILNYAEVPDYKSSPMRGQFCFVLTFVSGFMAVMLALLIDALKHLKNDDEAMRRIKGKK